LEPLEVDLNLSSFRLTGKIPLIHAERMIQFRYARVRAKEHLRMWVYHLALNRLERKKYPRHSLLGGLHPEKNKGPAWKAWEYLPPENAEEILIELLEIYWSGLVRPLHFFPQTSWVYGEHIIRREYPEERAMANARRCWEGNDRSYSEREDPYFNLCFKGQDPLDTAFQDLSIGIFKPLLACQEEIKS
jgi:exodeoxyribonuclease V gamma subunit